MARPPLALGHHGSIKVTREGSQWVARLPGPGPRRCDSPRRAVGTVADRSTEGSAGRAGPGGEGTGRGGADGRPAISSRCPLLDRGR